MKTRSSIAADWNRLFDFSVSQHGLFTAQRAAEASKVSLELTKSLLAAWVLEAEFTLTDDHVAEN